MSQRVVWIRFSRPTDADAPLEKDRVYQTSVNGGPYGEFRSPWDQAELDTIVEILRNEDAVKPTHETLKEVGCVLGDALHQVRDLPEKLEGDGVTLYLDLDHPELARIPWELACRGAPPHHHLLLDGVSLVRRVSAAQQDAPAAWPTGLGETLRLLFVWGQRRGREVPVEPQREALEAVCRDYGVALTSREVADVEVLAQICREAKDPFHFVHVLAHGARADDDRWGLALSERTASGVALARALVARGTSPALVTLSACDSANERDASFGSVAYQLHVHGVPLVLASQFRLRKSVAAISVGEVYRGLLTGGDPLQIVHGLRRQLAPRGDEGWANEVLYSRYRQESLEELGALAQQQAALRRARVIAKDGTLAPERAIAELRDHVERLQQLVAYLESRPPIDRAALAETHGLLGSLRRRIAELRAAPPDAEELRAARREYELGFAADANSHYCGINVIHLSRRLGDDTEAEAWLPIVRRVARNEAKRGFWALATLGDVEVYAGNAEEAAASYREFVAKVEASRDVGWIRDTFESSLRPLKDLQEVFPAEDAAGIHGAALAATRVLESAIRRCQETARGG